MNPPLERQRELSFNPDARTKKTGYDSQVTRHMLSDSVTTLRPEIKPYDWQVDVAEALALDLDATIIAGTGSGKTLAWALPLLLDENRDKFCVVISPLNELEADLVWRRRTLLKFWAYYRACAHRLAFLLRNSKYLPWPSTMTHGMLEIFPYRLCVSNAHYMRLSPLMGPTGERETLPDHSNISRDMSG